MTRLGTPYERQTPTKTDSYTILPGDDLILFNIATAKNATLPAAADCNGSDGDKVIASLGTSGDTLTLVPASGDSIVGASTLAPGTAVALHKGGPNIWTADSPFSAEGLTTASISTADSKGVSSGTRASVADSKAVSDSVLTSTADSKGASAGTGASTADSKAVSNSANISVADSKGASGGSTGSVADSKALSVSTLTSTADSKAVSDGLSASVATSAATSNSVVISSLTSRVSSKGG